MEVEIAHLYYVDKEYLKRLQKNDYRVGIISKFQKWLKQAVCEDKINSVTLFF